MTLGYEGKVALVTGGTRGIGLATALELRSQGCAVAITGRDGAVSAELQERLANDDGLVYLSGDLGDPTVPERLVSEALEARGRLDVLVNNAASFSEGDVLSSGYEEWERIYKIKVFGYVGMIRAAIPALTAAGGGAIVNVAGVAGVTPIATSAHAGAANAAVLNLTKLFAKQLAPLGIRVNAVIPGSVKTDRFEARVQLMMERGGRDRVAVEQTLLALTPSGYAVEPAEIGLLIATLCSSRLPSLVGAAVTIDGGRSL